MKTAESVSPMHPDKICDRISDAILDACLEQDLDSRCAIETMGGHGIITITGEMTTNAYVDIREIVKKIIGDKYGVQVNIVKQSNDIAKGVDTGGAGDQGIMIGYACSDNEAMIPQELYLARSLCKFIYKEFPYDGKTQITLDENNNIQTLVASFQNVSTGELRAIGNEWLRNNTHAQEVNMFYNPAGDWSQGGFEADTGLTGRKLAVDNYGTHVALGGGCFSGKDATKVDRSGAYMARKIAVDLLKKYEAKIVKISLAYVIGIAEPIMANATIIFENLDSIEINPTDDYDLTPQGIIKLLELRKPQYERLARWGHFGENSLWDK